jgi:CRP-like cAMP-binding protein
METFRMLLFAENDYRMKDETMDMFFEAMSEIKLKAREPLIDYGAFDSNIYVIRSGIIRIAYFNGFREVTHAFGTPGTMTISYFAYFMDEPSFFKFEACCDSVVMKITKVRFLELIRQSHDFAQWVTSMLTGQLWAYEKKLQIVNGNAKERFEALVNDDRPEIMKNVSSKIIASYIGVTPIYLCKLKRDFSHKLKK